MATVLSDPVSTVELIQRLRCEPAGGAWADVIHRHADAVYQAAYRITADPSLAEDATQEAFLHMRQAARLFQPRPGDAEAAARGWILRIACTTALQLMRSRHRQLRRERQMARSMVATETAESEAGSVGVDRDLLHRLHDELSQLPDGQRLPLMLHVCAGLSYQHIAQQVGCTPGSARVRVHRALHRLRRRLSRPGAAVVSTHRLVSQLHAGAPVIASSQRCALQGLALKTPTLLSPSLVTGVGHARDLALFLKASGGVRRATWSAKVGLGGTLVAAGCAGIIATALGRGMPPVSTVSTGLAPVGVAPISLVAMPRAPLRFSAASASSPASQEGACLAPVARDSSGSGAINPVSTAGPSRSPSESRPNEWAMSGRAITARHERGIHHLRGSVVGIDLSHHLLSIRDDAGSATVTFRLVPLDCDSPFTSAIPLAGDPPSVSIGSRVEVGWTGWNRRWHTEGRPDEPDGDLSSAIEDHDGEAMPCRHHHELRDHPKCIRSLAVLDDVPSATP